MLDVDLDIGGLAAQERALADYFAVAAHHDPGALAGDALVVEPVGDGLGLPDDAEPRRGRNRDAAIALVLASGDERVHRRLEAEGRGVGRNVVHPAIRDQKRAGDAVDGNVRQRRGQRAEQFGSVGFAVGLSGLDDAHFQPLDLLQRIDQRLLRLGGFLVAGAKVLTRALVDHDGSDRRQRLAVFAGEGGIGERQQDQRQRRDAHGGTARAPEQQ